MRKTAKVSRRLLLLKFPKKEADVPKHKRRRRAPTKAQTVGGESGDGGRTTAQPEAGQKNDAEKPPEKVGVFVDVQNLFHSSKNLHYGKVNFQALLDQAVAGRQLTTAIAYTIYKDSGQKERDFFSALRHIGFQVKSKRLQEHDGGRSAKGDWDVGLAVDAIDCQSRLSLDTVVIVSGDGDFTELVDHLKTKGVRVEVISFRKSTSPRLVQAADQYVNLSNDPRRFVIEWRA